MVKYLGTRNIAIFSMDLDSFDFKIRSSDGVIKNVLAKLEKKGWMTPAFVNDNTLEFRMNDLRMSLAAWVACPVRNGRREQALYVIPRPKAGAQVEWKRETWHTRCQGLNAKRVWLNAPVHPFLTPLGN